MSAPIKLELGSGQGTDVAGDDSFDYSSNDLALEWSWNHNPDNTAWSVTERPGWLRLRGQESLSSTNQVSLLVRKLTGVRTVITTRMDFTPELYQHSAGLVLYYDSMNYVWLRKTWSEEQNCAVLSVQEVDRGVKNDHRDCEIPAPEGAVRLRLRIEGKRFAFSWSLDGERWTAIGPDFPTWHLSDEHSGYGEFTGTMYGLGCVDAMLRRRTADFDFLNVEDL